MMTYSLDFRRKVFEIKEKEGLSFSEIADRFKIGRNTVFKWSKNILPQVGRNKPAVKIDMEALRQDVEVNPDAYQYERAERFGVSQACIHFALKRLGVTNKKKPGSPKSRFGKAQ